MKITIDETKNGEVTISDFTNEMERKEFHNFIRCFNLLRIRAKEDKN